MNVCKPFSVISFFVGVISLAETGRCSVGVAFCDSNQCPKGFDHANAIRPCSFNCVLERFLDFS